MYCKGWSVLQVYVCIHNINITEARSTLLSMYWEGRGVTDLNYPDIAAIARLPKEVYEYGPLLYKILIWNSNDFWNLTEKFK